MRGFGLFGKAVAKTVSRRDENQEDRCLALLIIIT
jgi:hypothetical protein